MVYLEQPYFCNNCAEMIFAVNYKCPKCGCIL